MTIRAAAGALAALAVTSTIATGCSDAGPPVVTVAIIDTGIARDAPLGDMVDVDASSSVVPGGVDDEDGHGTEMAAVVHAAAPDARLVAVKAVGDDGTTDQRLATAIGRARSAGADVILLSMAGAEPLPRTRAAIERAGRGDVLVVAAAGNDGLDLDDHPAYPAAYDEPNLIAVAAIDRDGQLLGTSNRGPTVTARGQGSGVSTCTLDGRPATTGATSAAAALVAGTAARRLRTDGPLEDIRLQLESKPAFATAEPCS
ncbi:MAG TPA: S8 family serine peptidase [Acidimicrobiales bacterium]|nr:S8 family serine peptidase [Acidimicrobiales bacterium]